jgi:hypothetical protein
MQKVYTQTKVLKYAATDGYVISVGEETSGIIIAQVGVDLGTAVFGDK